MLARALEGGGRRAALLVLDGVSAGASGPAAASVLRRADALARLGDARVAVLAPHLRGVGGAADLAARILAALPPAAAPAAAVGIAVAPDDADDLDGLMRVAAHALARARTYARGRFAFADAARDARWRIGPLLAGAIAEALAEDQYDLLYQPIARLADGRQAGAEALLRWRRPGGEDWPPSIFIPEAERRGLMEPITAWTLRAACKALADLGGRAPHGFRLGVNLSATMLGCGAAEMVAGVLSQTGVAPEGLSIEITETAPFVDDAAAVREVEAIAGLGCCIAIDDFGAGHASLAYAVKLPASRIKIDGALTRAFLLDRRARAAVAATAALARDVGADVVAEGVASADVAAALADVGIAYGQGRHYGAPGPRLLDSLGGDA